MRPIIINIMRPIIIILEAYYSSKYLEEDMVSRLEYLEHESDRNGAPFSGHVWLSAVHGPGGSAPSLVIGVVAVRHPALATMVHGGLGGGGGWLLGQRGSNGPPWSKGE